MTEYPKLRVAAAHAAPVFLDAARSVDKACGLISEAAGAGAQLIAFPESFIPAFPVWTALQAPILGNALFGALAANSLRIDGPEIACLRTAARRHGIVVSMGFSEGTAASVGCLWNSNVLIGADGAILVHHRKLVPTFYEKLIWANGDGHGLRVADTPIGRIGALICGENTNPLARFALMAQGEQVHVASYPPVWPTRPTQLGNYDLEQAIRIRAGAHSFEAKVFTIVASAVLDKSARTALAGLPADAQRVLDETPRGVSLVVGPTGMPVSPTMDKDEGILYADIDLSECVEPKQFHDVVGYYNRFDVFSLRINRGRTVPAAFEERVEGSSEVPHDERPQTDASPVFELGLKRSKTTRA
ncbi:MAG: carbon-nitrogen hydrolase family protein [Burkholderiales bacterium]